ncbi:MAG: hypothetical protein R2742_12550 [Micropruina glycogenica]
MLPEQAQAITQVLDGLPTDFDIGQLRQAEELMVGFADTHNAHDLRSLSRYLVEVLDPDTVEAREAARWNATCAPRSTTGTEFRQ